MRGRQDRVSREGQQTHLIESKTKTKMEHLRDELLVRATMPLLHKFLPPIFHVYLHIYR
jgi:hypothetical protein